MCYEIFKALFGETFADAIDTTGKMKVADTARDLLEIGSFVSKDVMCALTDTTPRQFAKNLSDEPTERWLEDGFKTSAAMNGLRKRR